MRLIDADKLKDNISDTWVLDRIDEQPTVEAEPVRHGHWIGRPVAGFCTVRCSICNEPYLSNDGRWHYCPNCGAKMDEVKK